mgnify:CR=1 FL=1
MRLKLIAVLTTIVVVFMFMCSCVKAHPTQVEGFSVYKVYGSIPMDIYKVTTPNGTVYVARNGQGICTLN